jgi:uncharacterized protein YigE (DUF2233 family)
MAFAIIIAMAVIGGGCAAKISHESGVTSRDSELVAPKTLLVREKIGEGIEHVTYRFGSTSDDTIELFGFEKGKFRFGILATTTRMAISQWGQIAPDAVGLINGGYFMEDGSPSGFVSIDGVRVGKGMFDADKSVVIDFSDGVRFVQTSSSHMDVSKLKTSMQSYPLLMANGTPSVSSDSGKQARRSLIGTDTDGKTWIGVVSEAEISLYGLSRLLQDVGIAWADVVNLDGGPSTSLRVQANGTSWARENILGVPFVITVSRRTK